MQQKIIYYILKKYWIFGKIFPTEKHEIFLLRK